MEKFESSVLTLHMLAGDLSVGYCAVYCVYVLAVYTQPFYGYFPGLCELISKCFQGKLWSFGAGGSDVIVQHCHRTEERIL